MPCEAFLTKTPAVSATVSEAVLLEKLLGAKSLAALVVLVY
jgi:hypothetical protein